MQYRSKLFVCLAVFFITLFSFGVQNKAWAGADDCSNNGAPAVLAGAKVAGYNTTNPANSFNDNYANSSQSVVQKKGLAKFMMMMGADNIDAKAHYCWTLIEAALDGIGLASNIKSIMSAAIKAAIIAIVNNALMQACQAALGLINLIPSILSMFTSHLCLPMPKLNLPHFAIPAFGGGSCNGVNLSPVKVLSGSQGAGNQTIYWKLWNKQQKQ